MLDVNLKHINDLSKSPSSVIYQNLINENSDKVCDCIVKNSQNNNITKNTIDCMKKEVLNIIQCQEYKNFIEKLKNIDDLSHNWVSWEGQKLTRNIPDISFKTKKELTANEIELLNQGKYTSITRFDRPIEKFDNQTGKLSASKMAIMLQTNTYSLLQNAKLLENTIYLSPLKN